MSVLGLHHISIISADAQRTINFYTNVLGMRLVKQTVNFDDPRSYHLYFGNEQGTPGSIVTYFEWPGAAKGRPGIGGTHHFALQTANRWAAGPPLLHLDLLQRPRRHDSGNRHHRPWLDD
jgi:glyoxalase family protein